MKNKAGFTLIEVLVALAILGIALTAIIKSSTQNIKDTHYLQQKTIATWVGTYIINQTKAGLIKLPAGSDELSEEIDMLGQEWLWKASLTATPNLRIQKMNIRIYRKTDEEKVIRLVSYLYAQ